MKKKDESKIVILQIAFLTERKVRQAEAKLIREEMLSQALCETVVFSDHSPVQQLCLQALMPFVSYFLQFTRLALYLFDRSLMPVTEGNRNKHLSCEGLPTSRSELKAHSLLPVPSALHPASEIAFSCLSCKTVAAPHSLAVIVQRHIQSAISRTNN